MSTLALWKRGADLDSFILSGIDRFALLCREVHALLRHICESRDGGWEVSVPSPAPWEYAEQEPEGSVHFCLVTPPVSATLGDSIL